MHLPPAASHRVTRSRWHLRVVLVLWLAGGITALLLLLSQPSSLIPWLVLACALCAGCPALWDWAHTPTGLLQWDGQDWFWSDAEVSTACRITPVFDLQGVLLLRMQGDTGPARWLWLEAAASNKAWAALRRAVFGSQRLQHASKTDAEPLHEGAHP